MVARDQLLARGLSASAIRHRIRRGRLHPLWRGVYAVGRPDLTPKGKWMAAILSYGPAALLSHRSAAELWEMLSPRAGPIEVTVTQGSPRSRTGIVVHERRSVHGDDRTTCSGIPVTSPIRTILDLAGSLSDRKLEVAVNEADKLDLIDPERLRTELQARRGVSGVARLRRLLDQRTFRLTDSELERRFIRLLRSAGLPLPETGRIVDGFKVDFYWPDYGLVVETDGLRYHRTPAAQARDRVRDQAHVAAGLTTLRFTHAQIAREGGRVIATLAAVLRRLEADGG